MNRILNDLTLDVLTLVIMAALIITSVVPDGSSADKIAMIVGAIALVCALCRLGCLLWSNHKKKKAETKPETYKPTNRANLFFTLDTILFVAWLVLLLIFSRSPKPPYLVAITVGLCIVAIAGAIWRYFRIKKMNTLL